MGIEFYDNGHKLYEGDWENGIMVIFYVHLIYNESNSIKLHNFVHFQDI